MFLITVSNTVTDFFKMLTFKLFFKEALWGPGRELISCPKAWVGWLAARWALTGSRGRFVRSCLPQAARVTNSKEEQRLAGGGGEMQVGFSSHPVAQCPLPSEPVLGRPARCQVPAGAGMGPGLLGLGSEGSLDPAAAKP